jgi:hypothetical protein
MADIPPSIDRHGGDYRYSTRLQQLLEEVRDRMTIVEHSHQSAVNMLRHRLLSELTPPAGEPAAKRAHRSQLDHSFMSQLLHDLMVYGVAFIIKGDDPRSYATVNPSKVILQREQKLLGRWAAFYHDKKREVYHCLMVLSYREQNRVFHPPLFPAIASYLRYKLAEGMHIDSVARRTYNTSIATRTETEAPTLSVVPETDVMTDGDMYGTATADTLTAAMKKQRMDNFLAQARQEGVGQYAEEQYEKRDTLAVELQLADTSESAVVNRARAKHAVRGSRLNVPVSGLPNTKIEQLPVPPLAPDPEQLRHNTDISVANCLGALLLIRLQEANDYGSLAEAYENLNERLEHTALALFVNLAEQAYKRLVIDNNFPDDLPQYVQGNQLVEAGLEL